MGFCERFIGLVFGIVSNNWYSVFINGQPYGFFKSFRGVKQGDPLSPTLFILAAEAMSKGLNALYMNLYFCGFGLPKWSPKINHLSYADDTIIFSSYDATSLRLIMEVLKAYEEVSGQLINKAKSAFHMYHSTTQEVINKVLRITGIGRNDFPFTYLGCHIFYTRRKTEFYQGLMTKVLDKLQGWKAELVERADIGLHGNPYAYLLMKVEWGLGRYMMYQNLYFTGLGALYFNVPPDFPIDETINNICEVVNEDALDKARLRTLLPEDLANYILENIQPPREHGVLDKHLWMLASKGEFTVLSAWNYLRSRCDTSKAYMNMLVKGLPFKISFFMWKMWKAKLPLDDAIR
nr:uncharacterized protein LOC104102124 [Nicotiana tomentosiformis]